MKSLTFFLPFLLLVFAVSCQMEHIAPGVFPDKYPTKEPQQESRNAGLITILEDIPALEGKLLMPDDLLFSDEYEALLEDFGNTYNYGEEKKIIYLQINEMIVPTVVASTEFEFAIYSLVGGGLQCSCESPGDEWCLVGTRGGGVQYCDDAGCAECCISFIPHDVHDPTNAPLFRETDGILHQVE